MNNIDHFKKFVLHSGNVAPEMDHLHVNINYLFEKPHGVPPPH
jgi:hypothetical protein